MARRGGSVYDEREYYSREDVRGPPPVRVRERDREYEEVDTYIRREREPDRRPEFLRDDYGRTEGGPLVLRERQTETFERPIERRPRSPSPVRIRERIIERERSPSLPPVERIRSRVVERERERSLTPPDRLRARVIETRERVRERSPSPVRVRERIIERERRERTPSPAREERIRITETRETRRERTPSPSPSPSPPPSIRAPPIHQEIITHHRHIDHGFERARVPTPPPPPRRSSPRVNETDIDIYTSRNNTEVDIRKTSSRARTPQPTPSRRNDYYDDDIIYEQERDKLRVSDRRVSLSRRRSMSARPAQRERTRVEIRDDESEADYYARRASDRAYIGEAYNGATKDWAIVDVPPGTERVRMDGVGGGSEEITWQKYNGVRRSKFIPERDRESVEIRESRAIEAPPRRDKETLDIEISSRRRKGGGVYEREYERIEESSDRRVGMPRGPKNRLGSLWTEITKDLVVKEAIEELGYDFEETEYFYYIIQYLQYEDVLQLVQLSEQIRNERQHRLREIERERRRMERQEEWDRAERRRGAYDDERIIEREIIYDGARPRRRY